MTRSIYGSEITDYKFESADFRVKFKTEYVSPWAFTAILDGIKGYIPGGDMEVTAEFGRKAYKGEFSGSINFHALRIRIHNFRSEFDCGD
ncbi:hypothetical protein [Roseibium album]|uniref:hypothetical protein n=1 Tax=Roseibium album TaxID=311410 RepID=UPI0006D7D016|nr:hypothetical protein [Roseibium album]